MQLNTIISLIENLLSVEAGNLIERWVNTYTITIDLIISSFLNFGSHHAFKSFDFPS
jgi:hypothetical protein